MRAPTAVPAKLRRAFVRASHRAAALGLVRCSSGNLSLRLDAERMLIKASRAWLGDLTPDQISVCRIRDGALLAGPKPSAELGFHAGILRTRPGIHVVLHFQTPCATALACVPEHDVNYAVIPEIPFYIGAIGHVPYLPPGSRELAAAVTAAMRTHDLIQLHNHGQVTVGRELDHALQNAAFFELACEIIVRGGDRIRPMPAEEAAALAALRGTGYG